MKAILLYLTLLTAPLFLNSSCAQDSDDSMTVYYCIRHAEKDRSDSTNKNPDLTTAGLARSEKWAEVFKNIDFDAVYSTDYNRTQQTAMPTAKSKGMDILSYDPKDLYNADFKTATAGKTVLVVGHSNTTPEFVNKVLGKETYPWMDDANNGGLYIVTKIGETVSVQVLQID